MWPTTQPTEKPSSLPPLFSTNSRLHTATTIIHNHDHNHSNIPNTTIATIIPWPIPSEPLVPPSSTHIQYQNFVPCPDPCVRVHLIPPLKPNYRARVDRPTRTSQKTTTEPLSPQRLISSSSRQPDPQPHGHPAPSVRPGTPRAAGTARRTTTEIPAVEPALLVHVSREPSRREKISNAGTSPLRPSPPSPTGGTAAESSRRPPARRVSPEATTPRQDLRAAPRETLCVTLLCAGAALARPREDVHRTQAHRPRWSLPTASRNPRRLFCDRQPRSAWIRLLRRAPIPQIRRWDEASSSC
ncbi:uncharacterized protein M6B38_159705 [Iris pallida]|uniref:Uncharacterized protein n=1 Tax=Iris pallida TaxID=29817 RepID=A0AAX6F0M8_IRIPA|nr:uncharacterized protein M6B38_159705 [Iris pallida]